MRTHVVDQAGSFSHHSVGFQMLSSCRLPWTGSSMLTCRVYGDSCMHPGGVHPHGESPKLTCHWGWGVGDEPCPRALFLAGRFHVP